MTNLIPLLLAAITVSVALFMLLEAFQRISGEGDRKQFPKREVVRSYFQLFEGAPLLRSFPFITNLVGTITSLATVYIFFIGNAKNFGWLIFLCPITIYLSAYFTNALTKKLIESPKISGEMQEDRQGHFTAVVARLLWDKSQAGQKVAFLAKWLSIVTILSITWIEISISVDLCFAITFGGPTPDLRLVAKCITVFLVTGLMFYFVFRYGVRGVAIGDVILTPIIAIATVALLVGSAWVFFVPGAPARVLPAIGTFFTAQLSPVVLAMFGLQVLAVNLFLLVSTEAHWLRVWAFSSKRTINHQKRGVFIAAVIWILLCMVGFFAYYAAQINGPVMASEAIVSNLLSLLNSRLGSVFLLLFWAGATAALYSTIDAQLYSLLLCWHFNPKSGDVDNPSLPSPWNTLFRSLACGAMFAVLYGVTRHLRLPVEATAFLLIPLPLTLLPSLCRLARGKSPSVAMIAVPLGAYSLCVVLSLLRPEHGLFWPLLAPVTALLFTIPEGLFGLVIARQTKTEPLPDTAA